MTTSIFSPPVAMPDMSTPCAWAGVGSRESPTDVLALMTRIAQRLAELGHTLRTGAAHGADTAFEAGHRAACGAERLEVYLPWAAFEREARARRGWAGGVALERATMRAEAIAARTHPGGARLGNGARLLQSRNSHQVLGRDLDAPVAFVLCWTPDGATTKTTSATGGTGQALRLAAVSNVAAYNLKREDHRRAWEEWLGAT
jgi:hypothetical protein